MKKIIVVLIISIFMCLTLSSFSADGQNIVFRERVYPVGYGRIISVDSFTHEIVYNGSQILLFLTFYGNKTIVTTEGIGNATVFETYRYTDNYSGTTVYSYIITFTLDGTFSYLMYLNDGSSERVFFEVTGTGFSYIETNLLKEYELRWKYSLDEMLEISELMNADYNDDADGHHAAVLDTIDDSRALREGPVYFGYQMGFGFLMLFINPFGVLWLVIIIALIISSRRKEADIIRKVDEQREDMDIDTEELAVASRIAKARGLSTLASIKSIAPHLGVSAIIWRDIHKRYVTIASLLAAFDDTKFADDGRIEGPIADALTMWIRNSLTLEHRSKLEGSYRAPTVDDYVAALKRILQYVSIHLHLPNYEQYIHCLEKSDVWLKSTVKDLRPGGSGVFDTGVDMGRPDFSAMIDNVK